MDQSKHIQIAYSCARLFMRTFLLGMLLMGILFTAHPFPLTRSVAAQAALKAQPQDVSRFQPQVVVSSHQGAGTRSRAAAQIPTGPASDALPVQGTVPVTQRATGTVKPHGTVPQALTVISSVPGGPNFLVGQAITFDFVVSNTDNAATFSAHSGVGMGISFSAGLSNIVVSTSDWATNVTTTTSPTVFASLYTGPPVAPGGAFPVITISGVLTSDAAPVFAVAPVVFDAQSPAVVGGMVSVNVAPGTVTATPTVTGTITPTPIPLTSPNVSIVTNVVGGLVYQVGQNITMNMVVSNIDPSRSLGINDGVYIGDVLPFGLDNLSALGGSNWSINTSSTTGPSLFTAKYVGPPIAPGATFPPISVTATLTSDAVPSLKNIASAFDPYFPIPNIAFTQLTVNPVTTATPTPLPTFIPTPLPLLPSLPDVGMTQASIGGTTFQIGHTVSYALNVSSSATSGPVGPSNPIKVVVVYPVGLSNVTASGSNWSILSTSALSPTLLVATYRGQYPVPTGTQLPPIFVQGTVLATALPQLTSTAVVQVAGDSHPDNNLTNTTIGVSPLAQTPVVQPSPTPTSVVVPTATISGVVASLPSSLPDVAVTQTSIGSGPFTVGQQLAYVLSVKNVGSTGLAPSLLRLTEVIPVGLTNVSVSAGSSWRIAQSSTTSPLLISATYAGSYPVAPGVTLAPLLVKGTISSGIVSSMTCTAVVGFADDRNPSNNLANNTVFIIPALLPQSRIDEQKMKLIR